MPIERSPLDSRGDGLRYPARAVPHIAIQEAGQAWRVLPASLATGRHTRRISFRWMDMAPRVSVCPAPRPAMS